MVKIPSNVVDQVINGNDIVQVVNEHVMLEKKGRNYFGLCPFHSEKTPSFSVSPEKQIFHCFSCGEGGNVIQFIAKIDNISYTESIKKLASKINLHIEGIFDDNKSVEETRYLEINKFVSEYYKFSLNNTIEGKKALEYLHSRSLNDDIIKRFQIGLAPDSANSLYLALKSNNYSELAMLELGHVTKVNKDYYDKFKNRIMFPISDEFGNIIGFSGRVFLENHKNEPKYINTQETPIFKKGNIIYHLNESKKKIKQNNRVFLFEGFLDVIASVRSGLEEAVATMGTALTENHVTTLKKYTKNVVICFDGDSAGIEATKKAINILKRQNLNVFVINLPDGLDPDDYVNKFGEKQYLDYLNQQQKSYKEYMYELYFSNVNFHNIASLDEFKKKIFQLIVDSTPTERELFLSKLSNDIHVSVSTLQFDYSQYTQYIHKNALPSNHDVEIQERIIKRIEKNRPSPKKLLETQKIMIFFCLYNRRFVNVINKDTRISFSDLNYRRLYYELSQYYNTYDNFKIDDFLQKYVKEDKNYLKFVQNIYSEYTKYAVSYEDFYLEQCFAVVINELIAYVVGNLKEQFKSSNSDEEKLLISQKIVDQYKIIKVKK